MLFLTSGRSRSAFIIALLLITSFALAQDSVIEGKKESTLAAPSAEKLGIKEVLNYNGKEIALRAGARPANAEAGGIFFVQFSVEMSDRLQANLKAAGADIHDYIGANTYVVKAAPGSEFWSNSAVNSVVKPETEEKISPFLEEILSYRKPQQEVEVTAVLFPGTSSEAIEDLITTAGAKKMQNKVSDGRLFLKVAAAAVNDLADSEDVILVEKTPFAKTTHNNKTATQTGVAKARKKYKISGDGVTVGVIDGGEVFTGHKEFQGRLTSKTKEDVSEHSTHVAGTIGSAGKNRASMGMAYEASIVSYDYNGNVPVKIKLGKVNDDVDVFNNSWGYIIGWAYNGWYLNGWGPIYSWFGDSLFGRYTSESRAYDANIKAKNIHVIFSAGNDRGEGPGWEFYYYDEIQERLVDDGLFFGEDGPFRIIGPTGTAKNVLTVGATNGKTAMSSFSSWGPTDDGRLKPEIVAPGVGIFSTMPKGKYGKMSGTSMSAPVVTGSVALLIEQWRNQFDEDPTPEVIRALVAVTSRDLGTKGPDYKYGFGALDMAAAGKYIDINDEKQLIDVYGLKKGKRVTYNLTIGSKNANEMRVVIAWLDPPGSTLVNDLDVRVVSPTGRTYKAWNPNPYNPSAAAKQTGNYRDNIEMVTVTRPYASSDWKIEIDGSFKKGAKQKYCMMIYVN